MLPLILLRYNIAKRVLTLCSNKATITVSDWCHLTLMKSCLSWISTAALMMVFTVGVLGACHLV